ncbi:MAG: hypothetical protein IJC78_05625 [Clostridia bacterium]|nr:hypothetical protein [Clostridia bacterium]
MKATANATVTPMFFLGDTEGSFIQTGTYPVDTSSKVTKDETTGVYSFAGLSVWSTLTGNIVTGDGTWQTYTCDFTIKDGAFTAGSSSTLAIDDYAKMKILLRSTSEDADAKIYLDDISLMQSATEYGQVDLTYRLGTELMGENPRKITSKYNSSVLNSITYKIVNSGVASDVTDGRYHLSAAGKTGDGAYAAVGKSSGYVRYQTSGYDLSKVEGNQFYRFTARLKAPAVTVDDTLDTDGLFYIDGKTGAVSAKTGAVYASSADDNAVLVYATYTSNGIELVDCEIVYITNGVYEADALPNNLETGDSTKVMLWKDMTSCAPLTPEVKD